MGKLLFVLTLILFGIGILPMAYAGEGFDAGYAWGQTHDIDDVYYSNGNSESFNEGVRAYAEDAYY